MGRLLSALVLLLTGLLLSSCSLLSAFFESSGETANARMEEIADALNTHDAVALQEMFSPYALEHAPRLDEGLEYLLSLFPDGGVTWKYHTVDESKETQGGQRSAALWANYTLSAGGTDYRLHFAEFVANDENPAKLGLYGLGVTPLPADSISPADVGFGYWAGGIGLQSDGEYGYPGIYVPDDDILYPPEQSDARMDQIAAALNGQDTAALKALFATSAIDEATDFDESLAALVAMFPKGGITWDQSDVFLVGDELGSEIKLLRSAYVLATRGDEYFVYVVDILVNTDDSQSVGLATLAVTPRYDPLGTDRDEDYLAWISSWDFDAEGRVGIYVPVGSTPG